jgi:dienelactone hydrolase
MFGWPGQRQDDLVPYIALFHSVYGLRPGVLAAAELLRGAGHCVVAPDLYAGQVAASIEEGFALSDRIGWTAIMQRARQPIRDLPLETVLAGLIRARDLLPVHPGRAGRVLP